MWFINQSHEPSATAFRDSSEQTVAPLNLVYNGARLGYRVAKCIHNILYIGKLTSIYYIHN